jgi:hypothetical protein
MWPICPAAPPGCSCAAARAEEADRLGSASTPAWASPLAELRGHERRPAEELGQWKTRVGERKLIDASQAAITLVRLLTDEEFDSLEKTVGDGEIARGGRPGGSDVGALKRARAMVSLPKYSPPMPRPPTGDRGWMAVEALEQWKTHHEERKVIDASPAAITLAMLMTGEELDSLAKGAGVGEIAGRGRPGGSAFASPQPPARHGKPTQVLPANAAPPTADRGWMAGGLVPIRQSMSSPVPTASKGRPAGNDAPEPATSSLRNTPDP